MAWSAQLALCQVFECYIIFNDYHDLARHVKIAVFIRDLLRWHKRFKKHLGGAGNASARVFIVSA
eukprot:7139414-Alexandrium_andersonii.AAC.1